MSAYHSKGKSGRGTKEERPKGTRISSEVALSLEAIRQRAKEGLLALCVGVGLNTLEVLFEQELEEKPARKASTTQGGRLPGMAMRQGRWFWAGGK